VNDAVKDVGDELSAVPNALNTAIQAVNPANAMFISQPAEIIRRTLNSEVEEYDSNTIDGTSIDYLPPPPIYTDEETIKKRMLQLRKYERTTT